MALIACARMYNVTPAARRAWGALFEWLAVAADVALTVIEHPAPQPLEALWARPDLGCAFMCGWPFRRAEPAPHLVAAPVPRAPRYGGRAIYFTDFIVRRDSGYRSLQDTFGGRIAWTSDTSHSGFNAPRHHLLAFRSAACKPLYRASVGPVVTPAGALESVLQGRADVAPMDSFALELMRRHTPERVADIAVVDSSDPAPFPPLVASPAVDAASVERLRGALRRVGDDPSVTTVLDDLGLLGFSRAGPGDYDLAVRWDRDALARGYLRPG